MNSWTVSSAAVQLLQRKQAPAPDLEKTDAGSQAMVSILKRPVDIFAFGVYISKQVNVSGIQHYLAQM